MNQKATVFGHAGAQAHAPANGLNACLMALEGAGATEVDLQPLEDGTLVLHHDDHAGGVPLAAMTVGGFVSAVPHGIRLTDLLTAAARFEAPTLNLEIKPAASWADARMRVRRYLADVETAAPHVHVFASSFDPRVLLALRAMSPRHPRALLLATDTPRFLSERWMRPLVAPVAIHPEDRLATKGAIATWRKSGLDVNVWTVNDDARARELASWGATGIITDDPARIQAALAAPSRE
jgi:glycerophosphoryl diester phosphodiesterase